MGKSLPRIQTRHQPNQCDLFDGRDSTLAFYASVLGSLCENWQRRGVWRQMEFQDEAAMVLETPKVWCSRVPRPEVSAVGRTGVRVAVSSQLNAAHFFFFFFLSHFVQPPKHTHARL